MKRIAVLIAALIALLTLFGCAGWSNQDIAAETAWQIGNVIDWSQTRTIAKNPDIYQERNVILGSHPTTESVDIFMAVAAIVHPVISHALPQDAHIFGAHLKPRMYWQFITIGEKGACIVGNHRAGITVDW